VPRQAVGALHGADARPPRRRVIRPQRLAPAFVGRQCDPQSRPVILFHCLSGYRRCRLMLLSYIVSCLCTGFSTISRPRPYRPSFHTSHYYFVLQEVLHSRYSFMSLCAMHAMSLDIERFFTLARCCAVRCLFAIVVTCCCRHFFRYHEPYLMALAATRRVGSRSVNH